MSELDDLLREEAQDDSNADRAIGGAAVASEQAGYQRQLDAQKTSPSVGHYIEDAAKGLWNGIPAAVGEMAASVDSLLDATLGTNLAAAARATASKAEFDRADAAPTTAGDLAQGLTQFAAGMIPLVRATRVLGLAGTVGRVAAGGVIASGATQATAFNPENGNFSSFIESHPSLANPVNAYLATQPGDSEADARMKNFLEGATFGAAGEGGAAFLGWLKGARAAKALAEDASAAADVKPTEVPSTTEAPTAPTSEAPAATPTATPEGATAGGTAGAPEGATAGGTAGAPEGATAAESVAPKPWTPDAITAADTAHPEGQPQGTTWSPEDAAKAAFSVPADRAQDVLEAINSGKYSDIPAMLDDTHRTIPWDSLSDGANLKGLFNAVEGQIGSIIKDGHGTTTVPASAIRQLAADIGGDRSALGQLYSDTTAGGGLAARITAGYNILLASARQLKDLAEGARLANASTPEGAAALAAFERQLNLHAAITGEVRQSSSEIGRALYAHRALKASTDVALQQVRDYAGTTLGPDALRKFVDTIKGGNLADITNATDAVSGKTWGGVLREVAQNGMLSAPTTQIANVASNVGSMFIKSAERYIAGGIGTVRGVLMPNSQTASLREAVAHTAGVIEGLRKAFPMAAAAARDENYSNMFTQATPRAITSDNPLFRATPGTTYANVIDATGRAIRWPGRLMGLFDHFTQSVGYEGDLAARSYVQAAGEADAKGLSGGDRDAFLDQRIGEIRANPTAELQNSAMEAGKYSAFLEDSKVSTNITKALTDMHPIVKLVVAPFIHRPWNFLRQAMGDYTPLGLASSDIRGQIAGGGSDADLAMARMTMGTSAVIAGYEAADAGYNRGTGKGSRNTQSLDQVPQNSVKLGGNWFRYSRLDPVGLWLGLGADLHEAIHTNYDPDNPDSSDRLSKAAVAAVQAVGNVAMDKSFMKSADMIMQAIGDRHDPAHAAVDFARLLSENVTKLLPFSGASRAITHGTDDTARQTSSGSLLDGLRASIPYVSQSLPPKLDLLGRPVQAPSSWNPLGAAPSSADPLDQALSKLAVQVNVPSRVINGYALSGDQWDQLVKLSTSAASLGGGLSLEDRLRQVVASDQWKTNETMQDGGQMINGKVVQSIIDGAYAAGREKFLAANPQFTQLCYVGLYLRRSLPPYPAVHAGIS